MKNALKSIENVTPQVLCGSKIHMVLPRYITYMSLTYNVCGNYTISMHVLYKNNIYLSTSM